MKKHYNREMKTIIIVKLNLYNSEMETIIMMKCKPFEMRNEDHYNREIQAIIIGT